MQTGCHGAYVGSRLKRLRPPGRRHLKSQPSSRIGENPPYGMIGGIEETSASSEARSAPRSYPTDPHRPRVMRSCPRGSRRSVDRGAHRPAIEPRKSPILGADAVQMAEGNTSRRVIASARTTRRGQRPWHVQTLLAREPGDLAIDRSATAVRCAPAHQAGTNEGRQGTNKGTA